MSAPHDVARSPHVRVRLLRVLWTAPPDARRGALRVRPAPADERDGQSSDAAMTSERT
jgi:hypothetical protein